MPETPLWLKRGQVMCSLNYAVGVHDTNIIFRNASALHKAPF